MSKNRIPTDRLRLFHLLLLGAVIQGCGSDDVVSRESAARGAEAVAEIAAAPATPRSYRGIVRAVSIGGGYSFIEVEVGEVSLWLASSVTPVSPGDEIAWQDFAVMTNFRSKSLNRTFDRILFVDRIVNLSAVTAGQRRGIVTEAVTAAGYSYLRVDENGRSVWLAAPQTSVEVGQAVEWSGGSSMRNFSSPTLNRVFDEIIFVGGVRAS